MIDITFLFLVNLNLSIASRSSKKEENNFRQAVSNFNRKCIGLDTFRHKSVKDGTSDSSQDTLIESRAQSAGSKAYALHKEIELASKKQHSKRLQKEGLDRRGLQKLQETDRKAEEGVASAIEAIAQASRRREFEIPLNVRHHKPKKLNKAERKVDKNVVEKTIHQARARGRLLAGEEYLEKQKDVDRHG